MKLALKVCLLTELLRNLVYIHYKNKETSPYDKFIKKTLII